MSLFTAVIRLRDMDKDGALEVSADVSFFGGRINRHVEREMSRSSLLDSISAKFPMLAPVADEVRGMLHTRIAITVGDSNKNGKTDLKLGLSMLGGALEQELIYDVDAVTLMGMIGHVFAFFAKKRK